MRGPRCLGYFKRCFLRCLAPALSVAALSQEICHLPGEVRLLTSEHQERSWFPPHIDLNGFACERKLLSAFCEGRSSHKSHDK